MFDWEHVRWAKLVVLLDKVKDLEESIKKKDTDLTTLKSEEVKLQNAIRGLKKDIEGLKKEIQERDETIQDKVCFEEEIKCLSSMFSFLSFVQEKRIYELKRKNQELEKFKFVLDYKIKELKKQIEPRELEIKDMKEQITNVKQRSFFCFDSNSSFFSLLDGSGIRTFE